MSYILVQGGGGWDVLFKSEKRFQWGRVFVPVV